MRGPWTKDREAVCRKLGISSTSPWAVGEIRIALLEARGDPKHGGDVVEPVIALRSTEEALMYRKRRRSLRRRRRATAAAAFAAILAMVVGVPTLASANQVDDLLNNLGVGGGGAGSSGGGATGGSLTCKSSNRNP